MLALVEKAYHYLTELEEISCLLFLSVARMVNIYGLCYIYYSENLTLYGKEGLLTAPWMFLGGPCKVPRTVRGSSYSATDGQGVGGDHLWYDGSILLDIAELVPQCRVSDTRVSGLYVTLGIFTEGGGRGVLP